MMKTLTESTVFLIDVSELPRYVDLVAVRASIFYFIQMVWVGLFCWVC